MVLIERTRTAGQIAEAHTSRHEVLVSAGKVHLSGTLSVPDYAHGLILFAHGTGSSRNSPRNRYVARVLEEAGFATLLMDLLTPEEEQLDARSGRRRFSIDLLANRLIAATAWIQEQPSICDLPIGYFGASTGAAAAFVAASALPDTVQAVVSRGGRPDLAGNRLRDVRCPTLLIVGGADRQVAALNDAALSKLTMTDKRLHVILGAGHLFEEGGLEQVADSARDWFARHLTSSNRRGCQTAFAAVSQLHVVRRSP